MKKSRNFGLDEEEIIVDKEVRIRDIFSLVPLKMIELDDGKGGKKREIINYNKISTATGKGKSYKMSELRDISKKLGSEKNSSSGKQEMVAMIKKLILQHGKYDTRWGALEKEEPKKKSK